MSHEFSSSPAGASGANASQRYRCSRFLAIARWQAQGQTCPVSTEGGTRRVHLVRVRSRAARPQRAREHRTCPRHPRNPPRPPGATLSDGRRPPPPLRTNRTRRVLHPVLIGHAASLTPAATQVPPAVASGSGTKVDTPTHPAPAEPARRGCGASAPLAQAPQRQVACGPRPAPRITARPRGPRAPHYSFHEPLRFLVTSARPQHPPPPLPTVAPTRVPTVHSLPPSHRQPEGLLHVERLEGRLGAQKAQPGRARASLPALNPPPPPRTKWTRRVPLPVLIGHAASDPAAGPGG